MGGYRWSSQLTNLPLTWSSLETGCSSVLMAAACRCAFKLNQILLQVADCHRDWFRVPCAGVGPFIPPRGTSLTRAEQNHIQSQLISLLLNLTTTTPATPTTPTSTRTFNAVPPMEPFCMQLLIPVACLPCRVNTLVVRSFASCLTLPSINARNFVSSHYRLTDTTTYSPASAVCTLAAHA